MLRMQLNSSRFFLHCRSLYLSHILHPNPNIRPSLQSTFYRLNHSLALNKLVPSSQANIRKKPGHSWCLHHKCLLNRLFHLMPHAIFHCSLPSPSAHQSAFFFYLFQYTHTVHNPISRPIKQQKHIHSFISNQPTNHPTNKYIDKKQIEPVEKEKKERKRRIEKTHTAATPR